MKLIRSIQNVKFYFLYPNYSILYSHQLLNLYNISDLHQSHGSISNISLMLQTQFYVQYVNKAGTTYCQIYAKQ